MSVLPMLLLLAATGQNDQEPSGLPEPGQAATQQSGPGLWIGGISFSQEDVAAATQEFDSYTAVPIVVLTLSETGHAKFSRAQEGRLHQVIEISLDGEILASPFLVEPIEGRQIMISGTFTVADATRLAERLTRLPPRR
jgi:preprotein translocase subunit SecD